MVRMSLPNESLLHQGGLQPVVVPWRDSSLFASENLKQDSSPVRDVRGPILVATGSSPRRAEALACGRQETVFSNACYY